MLRDLFRMSVATAAVGASALGAGALSARRYRLSDWETLTCDDCEEGDFVSLEDGLRMHYVQRGMSGSGTASGSRTAQGSDIILIHGLMSSTGEWAKNIDALAETHRVWAIDLIGFGYSSRVTEPVYSLQYYADTLRGFMDKVGIECAHLVGHSLGGGVALQFAHDHPERVERIVLIAGAAFIFHLFRSVRLAAQFPSVTRGLGSRLLANPRVHRTALCNALGDPSHLDTEMLAARVRASKVQGTLDALWAMMASPWASNLPDGLADIQAPCLVLWGDRDYVLPLRHGERLARELPNAELVILKGAGHVPNEEFPDTVNRLMLDFIRKDEGQPARSASRRG